MGVDDRYIHLRFGEVCFRKPTYLYITETDRVTVTVVVVWIRKSFGRRMNMLIISHDCWDVP